MTIRAIIDTDPGQDDALAILLALASADQLDVEGITTVAGNVQVNQTFINARRICNLAGYPDFPVYRGCSAPLRRPLHTAEFICGPDGLQGMSVPKPVSAGMTRSAVDFLIEKLSGKTRYTIFALAPLTNIAKALLLAPEIKNGIERLVIMGGAQGLGNITPFAEFNFFVDPDAAHIVFNSGLPITLFPLNLTFNAVATPKRIGYFNASGPVSSQVVSMLRRERARGTSTGHDHGHPMHDPCTVAWALWPELFETEEARVTIETAETDQVGQSTIVLSPADGHAANAKVATALDGDELFSRMAYRVALLDESVAPRANRAKYAF